MGARHSKLRVFCRKAARRRKEKAQRHDLLNDWTGAAMEQREGEAEENAEQEDGEEVMLLQIGARRGTSLNLAVSNARWADELGAMHREMDAMVGTLSAEVRRLETEHRRQLALCAKQWRSLGPGLQQTGGEQRARRKAESLTEECRLRGALLAEKFRNCMEYLQGFDALIHSIQREERRKSEEDDFLREFLLKAARRQHRKGQLGQAVDTFCQLMIATDGRLRHEEMALLAEVCREKIRLTREFHERVSHAVQMDERADENYAAEELWAQVLEDLRAECAEAYDIVMRVRGGAEEEAAQKLSVEQLKLLLASTICALWLHITPNTHDEFDEVKELFFRTLNAYIGTFRKKKEAEPLLQCAVRQLIGEYPKVAGTRKMRRIVRRLFRGQQKCEH